MPLETHIRPRPNIPDEVRTEGKDDCFATLEELRREDKLYGMSYEELAEHTDWSRQHVKNTIQDYYLEVEDEEVEREPEPEVEPAQEQEQFVITIPADVDKESYLRGWLAAKLDNSENSVSKQAPK